MKRIILKDKNKYHKLSSCKYNQFHLRKDIIIKSITINIFSNLELRKDETLQENHIKMVDFSSDYKNDYAMILARLRNAVAHARVKLQGDYLTFENIHNEKVNLIARIHKDSISEFINELHNKLK